MIVNQNVSRLQCVCQWFTMVNPMPYAGERRIPPIYHKPSRLLWFTMVIPFSFLAGMLPTSTINVKQLSIKKQKGVLFCPPVSTGRIGTNIVKFHFFISPPRMRLKENCFVMFTFGAGMFLSPRECWIGNHIRNNLSQFTRII